MEVIEWSDPPVAVRGPHATKWKAIADELTERPGQWALVARQAHSSNAAKMLKALSKHGQFEVVCRRDAAKPKAEQWGYWARFVPEAEAPVANPKPAAPKQPQAVSSNVVVIPSATATVETPERKPLPARDPFACDFCDQVFGDRHTKRHHERISHRGVTA